MVLRLRLLIVLLVIGFVFGKPLSRESNTKLPKLGKSKYYGPVTSDEDDRLQKDDNKEAISDSKKDSDEEKKDKKKLKGPQTEEEEEEEENAELNPKLFEGDLKLRPDEIEKLRENTVSKKDTVAAAERRWPNARVPIIIDPSFDEARKNVLIAALDQFNKLTCVRFVPKESFDADYIKFTVGEGCYSTSVGKSTYGGEQEISIGEGCNFQGTVIHEMMHAIGFFHEHTRLDRDQYITINWQNVQKGREFQFQKYAHGEGDYLNEPYDYDSVMQYPRDGFGVVVGGVRLATIVPKDKPWRKIGQRDGFSQIDLNQINKLYKCFA